MCTPSPGAEYNRRPSVAIIDGAYYYQLCSSTRVGEFLKILPETVAQTFVIDSNPRSVESNVSNDRSIERRILWHQHLVEDGVELLFADFKLENNVLRQAGADALIASHTALMLFQEHPVVLIAGDADLAPAVRYTINALTQHRPAHAHARATDKASKRCDAGGSVGRGTCAAGADGHARCADVGRTTAATTTIAADAHASAAAAPPPDIIGRSSPVADASSAGAPPAGRAQTSPIRWGDECHARRCSTGEGIAHSQERYGAPPGGALFAVSTPGLRPGGSPELACPSTTTTTTTNTNTTNNNNNNNTTSTTTTTTESAHAHAASEASASVPTAAAAATPTTAPSAPTATTPPYTSPALPAAATGTAATRTTPSPTHPHAQYGHGGGGGGGHPPDTSTSTSPANSATSASADADADAVVVADADGDAHTHVEAHAGDSPHALHGYVAGIATQTSPFSPVAGRAVDMGTQTFLSPHAGLDGSSPSPQPLTTTSALAPPDPGMCEMASAGGMDGQPFALSKSTGGPQCRRSHASASVYVHVYGFGTTLSTSIVELDGYCDAVCVWTLDLRALSVHALLLSDSAVLPKRDRRGKVHGAKSASKRNARRGPAWPTDDLWISQQETDVGGLCVTTNGAWQTANDAVNADYCNSDEPSVFAERPLEESLGALAAPARESDYGPAPAARDEASVCGVARSTYAHRWPEENATDVMRKWPNHSTVATDDAQTAIAPAVTARFERGVSESRAPELLTAHSALAPELIPHTSSPAPAGAPFAAPPSDSESRHPLGVVEVSPPRAGDADVERSGAGATGDVDDRLRTTNAAGRVRPLSRGDCGTVTVSAFESASSSESELDFEFSF